MNQVIQVKILGREYALRSQQSHEQVQKVAEFVSERIAETAAGRSVDTQDLTVLTLLNLAGQFLQLQDEEDQCREFEKRLQQLVNQLENAVSGC